MKVVHMKVVLTLSAILLANHSLGTRCLAEANKGRWPGAGQRLLIQPMHGTNKIHCK